MPARLVVDKVNQLQESAGPDFSQSRAVRITAKIISYIFHPIFVPLYIVLFLLYVHPAVFSGFSSWQKTKTLLPAIGMYVFFPLITVLLLKALNFIQSVYLHTQKDRIIPYIACNLWYFWIWYVWKNLPDGPPREMVILAMTIFLASVMGMIANIYIKISMHAIAAGVLVSFIIMLAFTQPVSSGAYISGAFLIGGLVCTARFLVSNHTQKEIYIGLLAGVLALFIAIWFN
ncbi:MAG: hypothetical protein WDO71_17580 [Bacteroidota bacterium]